MKNDISFDDNDLKQAVDVLRKGGIVLYPTDTVWGIGCDATNPAAVSKVYEIKSRNEAKALITLVSGLNMLERYVDGIPDVAYQLIEYTDKPLTIIYDKGIGLAANLLADDGSIAVRMVDNCFAHELCRRFGKPIVSTSANISGSPTPSNFIEISDEIKDKMDYICMTERDDTTKHKSSTIMKLSADGTFNIIRP